MNKGFVLALSTALLLSSCGTYTGVGAYTGTSLGSVLGSAIGGIADGPRGSDIGTIVGMAGGAVIGGAIGNAADRQRQEDVQQYQHDKAERAAARARRNQAQRQDVASQQTTSHDESASADYGSGFDSTNSGDDRIYDFNSSDYTGDYSAQQPQSSVPMQSSVEQLTKGMNYNPTIEIRNARFVDDNQDGKIERGELCKIIFEVMNRGSETLHDVQPTVVEATGNKHIFISPNMHVEKILPGQGIRYTAMIKADNRLKDGSAKFCVSVIQGTSQISKVTEFNIPTVK